MKVSPPAGNRRRWTVRIVLLLALGVAVLSWAIARELYPTVIIENRSGQPIAVLRVTMGEETKSFHDVPAGSQVSVPVQPGGMSLEGQLADGTLIRGRFGSIRQLQIQPGGLANVPGEK